MNDQPSTPDYDPCAVSEAYWSYVPSSEAARRVMERRARKCGRVLPWETPAAELSPPQGGGDGGGGSAAGEGAQPRGCGTPHPNPSPQGEGPYAAGPPAFTLERRVRFLDHLSINGNARAAAAHAGVSHETAYRARRQDARFAGLWDASLVHAREHSANVLATRALDGVEVAIVYHGEITGYRTVHDPRLLLAHMARLDRLVEGDKAAQARAARFDELLAGYAGQPEPAGFACAVEEAGEGPALPPTRDQFAAWLRDEASEDLEDAIEADDEKSLEALASVEQEAGAVWDAWHADGRALVGAILETPDPSSSPRTRGPRFPCDGGDDSGAPACAGVTSEGDAEDDQPPIEYKSAPAWRRRFSPLDRVTGVNAASPCPPLRHSRESGNPAQTNGRAASSGVTNSLWRGGGNPL